MAETRVLSWIPEDGPEDLQLRSALQIHAAGEPEQLSGLKGTRRPHLVAVSSTPQNGVPHVSIRGLLPSGSSGFLNQAHPESTRTPGTPSMSCSGTPGTPVHALHAACAATPTACHSIARVLCDSTPVAPDVSALISCRAVEATPERHRRAGAQRYG